MGQSSGHVVRRRYIGTALQAARAWAKWWLRHLDLSQRPAPGADSAAGSGGGTLCLARFAGNGDWPPAVVGAELLLGMLGYSSADHGRN